MPLGRLVRCWDLLVSLSALMSSGTVNWDLQVQYLTFGARNCRVAKFQSYNSVLSNLWLGWRKPFEICQMKHDFMQRFEGIQFQWVQTEMMSCEDMETAFAMEHFFCAVVFCCREAGKGMLTIFACLISLNDFGTHFFNTVLVEFVMNEMPPAWQIQSPQTVRYLVPCSLSSFAV